MFLFNNFKYYLNIVIVPIQDISEISIYTTDRLCDGKTLNAVLSSQWLSGPLRVVELGGPTDDKADAYAHDSKSHSTILDSSIM